VKKRDRQHQQRLAGGGHFAAWALRRSAGGLSRAFRASLPGKLILRFHGETRGAISVLVLLMVWCLVALVGLVWNTTEESQRRAQVQTAADSAAHAAATWMSRAVNTINAQNMVISQDATTEIIWRAVPPTDTGSPNALLPRLNHEITRAEEMKKNPPPDRLTILKRDLITIATEYDQTNKALQGVEQAAATYKFATIQDAQAMVTKLRQADLALEWANNTYVNGQPPPAGDPGSPPRPGPPGPNGEGLQQIVGQWKTPASAAAVLDYIINFIKTTEIPVQQAFHNRTQPGVSQPVDQMMAAHELQVYQAEVAFAQSVPAAIESEREQLAGMYHVGLTLATLKNSAGNSGPAMVTPPLMLASDIPNAPPQLDSIRAMYRNDPVGATLSPTVSVDPISPQADAGTNDATTPENAEIWHPDGKALVPPDLQALYGLQPFYTVPGMPAGGWGHVYAAPLERYVLQRAHQDQQVMMNGYMIPLDNDRSITLAKAIQQMLGVPGNGNLQIANLPARIFDVKAEPPPATLPGQPPAPSPPPVFDRIFVLPPLTAPVDGSGVYRQEVSLYNQHGAAFTTAIRNLRNDILNYTGEYEIFTVPFAADLWNTNVNSASTTVLQTLGQKKQFLVLSTYNLSPIPQWAKANMWSSAELRIENQLTQQGMGDIAGALDTQISQRDPRGLGAGILDPTTKDNQLFAAYADQAAQIADGIIRPTAQTIAVEVANEWVNRPWAYEIAPPQDPVPPFRGVSPAERMREFTVVAGARQTDPSANHLLLTKFFGNPGVIAAYAQAETFNWNEFNSGYGGGERIDQVADIPEIVYYVGGRRGLTYTAFTGEPRQWRVDSIGGWNWRARLSVSDALYQALPLNDELRSYMSGAGVKPTDSGALNAINLH